MCSVVHVAAGALIGSFLDSRLPAFAVGFVSHIPLDAVPHIDFEDFRVDAVLTLALLGGILLVSGFSPVFLGALGAVAPDFENLIWKCGIIPERSKVFPTHSGLIKHGRAVGGRGRAGEIVMSAFSVGLVVVAVLVAGGRN
ncbi:MAG: hypothetical protein ABIJ00_06390 [Candidatus Eisenbacteria bacterium]